LTEERSLGEVVDLFQLKSNSTTPSANRRTPLLRRKRRGNFRAMILCCISKLVSARISPSGEEPARLRGQAGSSRVCEGEVVDLLQ